MIATAPEAFMARVEAYLGMPPGVYPAAGRRVHVGIDLQIPDYVTDFLTEQTREQSAFLRSEFDATFCAML